MYPDIQLFVAGQWRDAAGGRKLPVINPATEEVIGQVAHASTADLDEALEAAARGFETWRKVSAFDRAKLMRKAADIFRSRADETARLLTLEQGKPLGEAKMEAMAAADIIDWFAEEARRAYGRVIPARAEGVYQLVVKEPVGPVAAFTPWNFPINQVVRKLSAAVATGCSIIVKAPEETPASPAALIRAFVDAGVPAGVVNLVFGVPAEISEYLIPHPVIRKVTFTGSTPIGKQLAALAGQHMKRVTMELGGHAPAIVFDDADLELAAKTLAGAKFRNAGQVCVSPTRFLVQEKLYEPFVEKFVAYSKALKVGAGTEQGVQMGPLAHDRRVPWIEGLVADARQKGAEVHTGGERIGNKGYFYSRPC
jgi:succinate-semialdehyde dehydrogenase/glutarate-semialdehyde dehydrogenase